MLYDRVHRLNRRSFFAPATLARRPGIVLPCTLNEEHHLKVLRLLQNNPELSQRDLAQALGVSLGKTNYCVRALVDKGLIKMHNFRSSGNKLAYAYLLTPAGMAAKISLTRDFLLRKRREYEALRREIEELQQETET